MVLLELGFNEWNDFSGANNLPVQMRADMPKSVNIEQNELVVNW